MSGPTPAGTALHFYTSESPSAGSLVASPEKALAGTYYARYEGAECASPVSVAVTISDCVTAFVCEDEVVYQLTAEADGISSSIYAMCPYGVGPLLMTLPMRLNSLLFSSADYTLWATKDGTGSLVRIGADGRTSEYAVAGLSGSFDVGAWLPGSYMLIYKSNQSVYYVVDVNPNRATYLRLVDPANGYAVQTGPTYGKAITSPMNVGDLAFDPVTGVYGVETNFSRLVTVDHVTGSVSFGSILKSAPSGVTFTAAYTDSRGTTLLNWSTSEETNSDHFEIERSADAREWKVIGLKSSMRESNSIRQYDFIDNTPAIGTNYYRLKMVDIDKTFAYSRVRSVVFGNENPLAAYPNPASDRLKVKDFAKVKAVVLYNAAGAKVLGRSALSSDGLDISKLVAGMYSVKLMWADSTETVQMVLIAR